MRLLCAALIGSGLLVAGVNSSAQDVPAGDANENARQNYEAFLELAQSDDPRRYGALRRLADIELERGEALLIDGVNETRSRAMFENAVLRYTELLAAYPDDEGSDAVYYQMARALEALGEVERARDVLRILVEEHPDSLLTEESAFREAEAQFSAGTYAQAVDSYARVIAWGEARQSQRTFLEQSWYKHGWALFKLADYEPAQASFLKLMRHSLLSAGNYSQSHHEQLTPGSREMLADALRALSLSFAYGEGVSAVSALLERDTAPGFEHLLFEDLGKLYRREERFHDAAQAYRAYVTRFPRSRNAPSMQLEVIRTYEGAGFAEQALAARKVFVRAYALNQDGDNYWTARRPADAADVVTALKLYLTELTRYYHARAQSTQTAADVTVAAGWYRAWLSSFPAEPDSAETHFLFAELLYDGQLYEDAVTAYELTAYNYAGHAHSAEAGYAALLAYRRQAAALSDVQLDAWEQRAIESALRFAKRFSDHEFATAVQTDAAERLFARGELDAAVAAATALLDWQPVASPGERHTAWLVSGHAYFDSSNYARAETAYQQALQTSPVAKSAAIVERLAAAVFRQAEQRQADGDLAGAAGEYLRVAALTPTSTLVPAAQYEAASVLMDIEDFEAAAQVLEAFRNGFPEHELQSEVTRNLSVSYLRTGDKDKAAAELMRLATATHNTPEFRTAANVQAVGLYRELHNNNELLTSYVYLVNELGLPVNEDIDAREEIAALFQKLGNESQYLFWVESIIDAHERAGAAATPRSLTAAAQAVLMFAEQAWAPFDSVHLTEPLQDNLKLKMRYMEALLQNLGQAAAYGVGPVTTAATYRMAAAYMEMATALLASERPQGLSAQELEQYEFLLEEQAFPFEEQAIEVHENNTRRVVDGVYDYWVRKSFSALGELMPGRYQKTEKGVSLAKILDQ